jgi:nicotinate-nucleotide--dimethylbenzimidazole phosphoribosyltransferase
MNWINDSIKQPSTEHLNNARKRQDNLSKPPGSLGLLETLAIRLAALQQRDKPALDNACITIFAADHGIAEEAVSAFPQSVTKAMMANFSSGGAAINALASMQKAQLEVVNVGVIGCRDVADGIIHQAIAGGTANFIHQAAMTAAQLSLALDAGRQAINRIAASKADVFIGGEMGIANTTSASALACALLKLPIEQLVGAGTGVSQQGINKKQHVIKLALEKHHEYLTTPLTILQYLGGFEIAALVAAFIRCGQVGVPVIVDGFIASVAALIATRIQPELNNWLFYGHQSEESGHVCVLDALNASPLLNLNMRLGEASGAALALSILRAACQLHNQMATFDEAGIH